MTVVERLADFVVARAWDDLSDVARRELKIRVLDSLGCAFGALGAPPVEAIRAQVDDFGGRPVALARTALNALRVTRTGALSQWKGLAYPFTAFRAVEAGFLAARGISGPAEVFEGNKGFLDSIAGAFEADWQAEDLERVGRTFLKRSNAEIHSQAAA